jgi:hypothetical protein
MTRSGTSIATAWIAFTTFVAGCSETPRREIALDGRTDHIEGWLEAGPELSVFPDKPGRNTDPYSWNEGHHCVTVVTESPDVWTAACELDGNRVRVGGHAVPYAGLDYGTSTHDVLLSKRYYKTTLVNNACLRDYIFVADRFERY